MERSGSENGFLSTLMQPYAPAMFRLIALALTTTFLLLALFGTSSEQVPAHAQTRAMGMMGVLATEAAAGGEASPRPQYVSRHHQPLKMAPDPHATVLRILPYGASVELIDAGHGNFAQVRDETGAVGFVQADSLSDRFPG